uniref:carboxyltransferase domain-containing protein n=1 Tax=Amycolatopsis kentuckyensis TaxID=218823 RepID=UPI001FC90FCA
MRALLEAADLAHPPSDEPREVTLDVRYDGADLALIASDAGVSPEAVVSMHTEAGYTVAFTGF